MKTTLEIPDALFRQAKATAAQQGRTLREFVNEAVQDKLAQGKHRQELQGWRAVLGTLPPEVKRAALKVDALINAPDFRQIDPEDWQ